MPLSPPVDTSTEVRTYYIRSDQGHKRNSPTPNPYRIAGGKSFMSGTDLRAAYSQATFDGRFNSLRNSVLRKVDDDLQVSSSIAVAIIERQKAIDLIANPMRKLISIIKAVKRRDPRILRRVRRHYNKKPGFVLAKDFSGLYLQYWFGWVPTLSDIHELLTIFDKDLPKPRIRRTSRAELAFNTAPSLDYNGYYEGNYFSLSARCLITGRVSVSNANLNLLQRFGVSNPVSVAWELMPFSWVVDYVVNVGELLSNVEPNYPGLTLKDFTTTISYKGSYAHKYWIGRPRGAYVRRSSEKVRDQGSIYYTDRVLGLPSYSAEIRLPFLNSKKVSYLFAVAIQLLKAK